MSWADEVATKRGLFDEAKKVINNGGTGNYSSITKARSVFNILNIANRALFPKADSHECFDIEEVGHERYSIFCGAKVNEQWKTSLIDAIEIIRQFSLGDSWQSVKYKGTEYYVKGYISLQQFISMQKYENTIFTKMMAVMLEGENDCRREMHVNVISAILAFNSMDPLKDDDGLFIEKDNEKFLLVKKEFLNKLRELEGMDKPRSVS